MPITPSQLASHARERCHRRLVVSGFASSTETRSAVCSGFAVTDLRLTAATLFAAGRGCQGAAPPAREKVSGWRPRPIFDRSLLL